MTATSNGTRTTATVEALGSPAPRAHPTAPPLQAPRPRRRPAMAALGVMLVLIGALAAAWLFGTAGQRTSVLTVLRAIPYGTAITASDLGTTRVAVDPGIAVVPAGDRPRIIGQITTGPLQAGALLSPGDVGEQAPPAAGEALVPLAIPLSRMPASGLQPGERVLVVDTPVKDADPPQLPPTSLEATVVRLAAPDLNGVTVVDVVVPASAAPALVARAATGRIALALEPRTR